jgi:PPK2 family polyphosphate:nucleotide phosphotransferase
MRRQPHVVKGRIRLKDLEPDFHDGRDKQKTKERTRELTRRIGEQQSLLYANARQSVVLLFQGLDASGKDGAIKRVLRHVNPAGVQTANFKVPTDEERAHDFLWRVHHAVPRFGYLGVFNRSHYEAVLVERVLDDLSRKVVEQRFQQIVDFERMLAENGVVLLKFFLHLSKEEQAERFRARLTTPRKKWKFARGDLVVRERWTDYQAAYEDMLNATSHRASRWHIVPADRKWYRDFVVATVTLDALKALKLAWPKPREDLSKIRIR